MGIIEQHWNMIAAISAVIAVVGGAFLWLGILFKTAQTKVPCLEEDCLKMPHVVRHMEFFAQILLKQTQFEQMLATERKITFDADERLKDILMDVGTNLNALTRKMDEFIRTYERDILQYHSEARKKP